MGKYLVVSMFIKPQMTSFAFSVAKHHLISSFHHYFFFPVGDYHLSHFILRNKIQNGRPKML